MNPELPGIADLVHNRSYLSECANHTRHHRWNVRSDASPAASRAGRTPRAGELHILKGFPPRPEGTPCSEPAPFGEEDPCAESTPRPTTSHAVDGAVEDKNKDQCW